jgi:ABC-type branched-subunit amino acid transport system permease subunit
MRWLKWFFAGALAVPLFHQLALGALYAAGVIDRAPFPMDPTRPFGVPAVISLAFWGGVWGVILGLVLLRTRGATYWIVAIVFGAIAPTLVAAFVAAPLKGQPAGGNARMALVGFTINAAWGLGTALIARLFRNRQPG